MIKILLYALFLTSMVSELRAKSNFIFLTQDERDYIYRSQDEKYPGSISIICDEIQRDINIGSILKIKISSSALFGQNELNRFRNIFSRSGGNDIEYFFVHNKSVAQGFTVASVKYIHEKVTECNAASIHGLENVTGCVTEKNRIKNSLYRH